MKEINISEELEKFLFNWFKKFEGKYIYFTTYDKIMRVFLVEEVALRKGRAKVKIGSCDNDVSFIWWLRPSVRSAKEKIFQAINQLEIFFLPCPFG